jgi:putative OPT family oligopeptide transporter
MANLIRCADQSCGHLNPSTAEACQRCGKALPKVHLGQFEEQLVDFELPIEGFKGTPEEIERQWYEKVYLGRGDTMKQLTWRAVIMGSVLGGILSLTNIYIGLKAGWGFGVAITACILSYAIWTTFYKIGLVRTPMTILENNCMQSTASSAGYSTGGTLISAYAAYMMITGTNLPLWVMLIWVFFLAVLGVTMAIPMKRQMINIEQLRFPSGVAAAETLRALHAHGESGMRSAKALGIAALIAALHKFWLEGLVRIHSSLEHFQLGHYLGNLNNWLDEKAVKVFGAGVAGAATAWQGRTVLLSFDPIFLAAGAITGLRVCASMMLGAITCWMIYIPILQSKGVYQGNGFSVNVQWSLWAGTACMVTSSLVAIAIQWKSVMRAFSGLANLFGSGSRGTDLAMEKIETPTSWFFIAQLVSLVALAWLGAHSFGMPWWQSAIAVLLTFFLALVACRVTGETDTTPVGAMGKVMQLTFGALAPGQKIVNLMSANITAAAAGSSADLLTDLKSGYLLGAHPRRQFIAQFAGIFIGTVATVFAFRAMVPDASILGTTQFPAPAALTWKGVAEALGEGLHTLHPIKVWGLIIGGIVGVILPLLTLIAPKNLKAWVPSAAGLGLAWVFPWTNALDFFLGSVIGYIIMKKRPKLSEEYTFPVASGLIAGGSLMGVALIFWENGPEIFRNLFNG